MGLLISWIALGVLLAWDYHKKKKAQRYVERRNRIRDRMKGD